MAIGTLIDSRGGGNSCPSKVACFKNTSLPSVEFCENTYWRATNYPSVLRQHIQKEPAYMAMAHGEAPQCGWTLLRENPGASIYYRVDNGSAPVDYDTIRRSANGAIWMIHNTPPWWDIVLTIGVPILIVALVFVLWVKGKNEKQRKREKKKMEDVWAKTKPKGDEESNSSMEGTSKSANGLPKGSNLAKLPKAHAREV